MATHALGFGVDKRRKAQVIPRQQYIHTVNEWEGGFGAPIRSGRIQEEYGQDSVTPANLKIKPARFEQNLFGGKIAELPKWILPVTGVILLVCGAANMLLLEMLNRTDAPRCPDCEPQPFVAPFVQQFAICAGEVFCFVFHFVDQWAARRRGAKVGVFEFEAEQEVLEEARAYIWIVPAICDYVFSLTLVLALHEAAASQIQALRSCSVLLCAILSVTFLRRDMRLFHWIGVCSITIGLIFTSWVSVTTSTQDDFRARWLGPALTLLGAFAQVFQMVFEERLLVNYRCSPFRGIGYIGIWHITIVLIVTVTCHLTSVIDAMEWWHQIQHSNRLKWGLAAFAFSASCFSSCALAVTKMGAALLTSIMTSTRQIPIWVIELGLKWVDFHIMALIGILCCMCGHLIYNQLIPSGCWPWWDRVSLFEVRMRCTCHDVDAEDSDEDWSEEDYEEMEDEQLQLQQQQQQDASTPVTAISAPSTTTGEKQHSSKKQNKKDDIVLKTAVVTGGGGTSAGGPGGGGGSKNEPSSRGGDSTAGQTTWIYIRRSEEWITDLDGVRKK